MDTSTPIRALTETEILSAVRKMFEGEHVTAIKLEPLIDQSETLGDLYLSVRRALDEHQRGMHTDFNTPKLSKYN